MNISFNWLRQLVRFPENVGPEELGRALTLRGIAVDAVRPVGAGIRGVIVAEVRGRRPHPKADKLTLVDVFDGKEVTQVVCGAPNVPQPAEGGQPGPRVLWARPGAQLPSGLTLQPKEVRGVVSPGMLCAEDELGLSEDHGGIVVLSPDDGLEIGADFAAAAGLPDWVLELDITPNRPDCLGHVGVAREVAALYQDAGAQLTLPAADLSPWLARGDEPAERGGLAELPIEIEDPQGCPRYTARLLTGVTVRPSPLRLRLLLQRLGVRAISNVVDATNLAMLEWGQPLHAFDRDKVAGAVVVRRARPGESLKTLDGQVRVLEPGDLLIADRDKGLAVAGVMGGEDSEVTATTRAILLESAAFDGASVRRTARRLKLHSEASHRFERGVDPNEGVSRASARCCELILQSLGQSGGGRVSPRLLDAYPEPILPRSLRLRPARTRSLLGVELSGEEQARLLVSLSMGVAKEAAAPGAGRAEDEALSVTVPTSRPDLTREVDLIEEVGRLYGYDRVSARLPPLRIGSIGEPPASGRIADRARDLCRALGLDEIQTFSFVAPERLRALGFAAGDRRREPLLLENPLREELSAMRTQLVVGLLEALRHNLSHGEEDLRLFEIGEVFLRGPAGTGPGALPEERSRVAGVLCGRRDHWLKAGAADQLDFHDVRGVVEELLTGLGVRLGATGAPGALQIRAARPGEAPWLHPGVSAVLLDDAGAQRGELGELHPGLREALGIDLADRSRAFAFEVDLPAELPPLPAFQPLPRYPGAERDLSFFVDAEVPAGELVALLQGSGEPLLTRVRVLEDYREAGRVPAGKKGLLLGLQYRSPERTLTDEEVQKAHDAVVAHLRGRVPVELR